MSTQVMNARMPILTLLMMLVFCASPERSMAIPIPTPWTPTFAGAPNSVLLEWENIDGDVLDENEWNLLSFEHVGPDPLTTIDGGYGPGAPGLLVGQNPIAATTSFQFFLPNVTDQLDVKNLRTFEFIRFTGSHRIFRDVTSPGANVTYRGTTTVPCGFAQLPFCNLHVSDWTIMPNPDFENFFIEITGNAANLAGFAVISQSVSEPRTERLIVSGLILVGLLVVLYPALRLSAADESLKSPT